MDLKNTHILVTGGAGFIGSNLVEQLVILGAHVTVVDAMISPYGGNMYNLSNVKDRIIFINDDIRNTNLMRDLVKNKDIIFHLAGQTGRTISMENPYLDLDINCNGTLSILEAMKKENRKAKLIFSSSRGVIGMPTAFPVDENHPVNPRDVYGANKLAAEKYCLLYANEYEFPTTILRFNNVYGPRCQVKSNHYGTINLFIKYALQGVKMPIYGEGKQTRDYIYVDDVVNSLLLATNKIANNEMYFVGSGEEVSLLELARIIQNHVPNSNYQLVAFPPDLKSIDFPRFVSSSKKIQDDLQWTNTVSIEEGIIKTIEFYKKNLASYL